MSYNIEYGANSEKLQYILNVFLVIFYTKARVIAFPLSRKSSRKSSRKLS